MVSLEQPCTACTITTNLVIEILTKRQKKQDSFDLDVIKLKHIKELCAIEGVEVEKLPLIIVDGEQITAGTFPSKGALEYYFR